MADTEATRASPGLGSDPWTGPSAPGGLLDMLGVAAVVLDERGRIVLWSTQAEQVFGYRAEEALGRPASRLLVPEPLLDQVLSIFAQVMGEGTSWSGVFPVHRKDGSTRLVEFRTMRLQSDRGSPFALGIAVDQATAHGLSLDLALSTRLITQSPIGLSVIGPDMRYIAVNPALAEMHGVPASAHLGRRPHEVVPFLDAEAIETAAGRVLATGAPLVDRQSTGRTPADPDHDHTWSASYYRLEDPGGKVLGVAISVVDVTERHLAAAEAERAHRRLAWLSEASARIGTTLEVQQTARELAEAAAPEIADIAAIDVLEAALQGRRSAASADDGVRFRALALFSARPSEALDAADPPGSYAYYPPDRLVTQCVRTGAPVCIRHVDQHDLLRIARSPAAAAQLARAGVHSYMAVPLIARGQVLGALDLKRTRNPLPFDDDDVLLASELAARAAISIDNARWFQATRATAVTLQSSLLPTPPEHLIGLEAACRYHPAATGNEVGGDWYDIIPLDGDKTALVVGDVMGNDIAAAATMGRLRTATSTLAGLDLSPDQVLLQLDKIVQGLENYTATCIYAVYDPRNRRCHLANAGHLPPVLRRSAHRAELLDLPTGVPLGVGGVPFRTCTLPLSPGDQFLLYTDGLVETRHESLDQRLDSLVRLFDAIAGPDRSLGETCDQILQALRHEDDPDDIALLLARIRPGGGSGTCSR